MSKAALVGTLVWGGVFALAVQASAQNGEGEKAGAASSLSNLSGLWVRSDQEARFQPPPSGPGPLRDDPAHPHHGHREGVNGLPDIEATPWVADLSNPILKPWVAEALKKNAARGLAGDTINPPFVSCRPSGVPGSLVLLENVQVLQSPTEVTIMYQRDHQMRHIYLNVAHSKNPKPSYYGESVGHWEGDTLVVDTIGLNDKTMVDLYSTPHSDAIHVVERYHVVDAGKTLQVDFSVDDPKAFNMPWSATVHYRQARGGFEEIVCAENNIDVTTGKLYPIPIAGKPDF